MNITTNSKVEFRKKKNNQVDYLKKKKSILWAFVTLMKILSLGAWKIR